VGACAFLLKLPATQDNRSNARSGNTEISARLNGNSQFIRALKVCTPLKIFASWPRLMSGKNLQRSRHQTCYRLAQYQTPNGSYFSE